MKNNYIKGDHNVISDDSGQKFKRSEMRYTWDGKLVHALTEWQPKHPQLNVRGRKENIAVKDTRTQRKDPPVLNPPISGANIL